MKQKVVLRFQSISIQVLIEHEYYSPSQGHSQPNYTKLKELLSFLCPTNMQEKDPVLGDATEGNIIICSLFLPSIDNYLY